MKLLDFLKEFPTEDACRAHFKAVRDEEGVFCKRCSGKEHWWLQSRWMYQCKHCDRRMSLRSGTVMENSKLPFQYWYAAIHLMVATRKNVPAPGMQRQLGHAHCEPVWAMMHKLRCAMANRDGKYKLPGGIELDKAFFTVNEARDPSAPVKRGAGSERQAKVVVMAESTPGKGRKNYRCGHFKMAVAGDLKAETIDRQAKAGIDPASELRTDNSKSHKGPGMFVKRHIPSTLPGKEGSKALPWVHTAISNAKAILLATYHGISRAGIRELPG